MEFFGKLSDTPSSDGEKRGWQNIRMKLEITCILCYQTIVQSFRKFSLCGRYKNKFNTFLYFYVEHEEF